MLLEVAGLNQDAIAERTRKLADGDWSGFNADERVAFAFARKQSKAPWSVTDADIRQLTEHFGKERALDLIWWTCRCHFMTTVADAFQLSLERENVFQKK
jgi:alkylhydroperoxidase family enzyme